MSDNPYDWSTPVPADLYDGAPAQVTEGEVRRLEERIAELEADLKKERVRIELQGLQWDRMRRERDRYRKALQDIRQREPMGSFAEQRAMFALRLEGKADE